MSKISTGLQDVGMLAVAILVCFGTAAIGAAVTTPKIPFWYAELAKPDWAPPNWIFGPVWTLLYLLMAIAVWQIWRVVRSDGAKFPLVLFAVQLTLNSLWSVLFFGLASPGAAAIEIIVLWVAILATVIVFWRRSPWAGGLMLPYLVWVGFAMFLNFSIWRLNS